jgi:hypothetical protein
MDVKGAEIQLKFAIAHVQLTPPTIQKLINSFASKAAQAIIHQVVQTSCELSPTAASQPQVIAQLQTYPLRLQLEQRIKSSFLQEKEKMFTSELEVNMDYGRMLLNQATSKYLGSIGSPIYQLLKGIRNAMRKVVKASEATSERLMEELNEMFSLAALDQDQVEMDVIVDSESLENVPAEAISEITFTTHIQNYNWANHQEEAGNYPE